MRYILFISALSGVAFAQYHVPTEGGTIVPAPTTEDVNIATTTVFVTVTSIANASATLTTTGPTIIGGTPESLWTYPTVPTGGMTEPVPDTSASAAPYVPGNGTSVASSAVVTSGNGTVIVTSTVAASTVTTSVIVTSVHSHSEASHTASASATVSTAGVGELIKPGSLAMAAGMVAAFL